MALGLEKGDHVAVWGQNVPEWVTLQFATGKMGAVLVTVNPAYKAHELKYVLDQSDSAALFLTRGVKDADFVEILAHAVPELAESTDGELSVQELPHLKHVVLMGEVRTWGAAHHEVRGVHRAGRGGSHPRSCVRGRSRSTQKRS